jgi:hypothetical protein
MSNLNYYPYVAPLGDGRNKIVQELSLGRKRIQTATEDYLEPNAY